MRKKRHFLLGGIVMCLLLAACGAPAQPTQTAEPPVTILPTNTPEPTATTTPTATPENLIFRDDFSGSLQPGWTWENEKPARRIFTEDGWLQITGEDPSLLYGEGQSNVLFRDLPEGDFAVTVHLKTEPSVDFAQAAIILYEDLDNYVAVNRGYCGPCFPGKGNGVFMDYRIAGKTWTWDGANMLQVDQTDLYLRLVSKDQIIYAYYAFTPDDWQYLIRLGNFFEFKRVGLGVTNADIPHAFDIDVVGSYDYFEITRP